MDMLYTHIFSLFMTLRSASPLMSSSVLQLRAPIEYVWLPQD
jgi:hypothetical protein